MMALRLRPLELALFLFPIGLLLLGLASLELARGGEVGSGALAQWLAFAVLLLAAHLWIAGRRPLADQRPLAVASGLAAIGLTMVSRLAADLALRQLAWVALGLVVCAAAATFPYGVGWLKRYRYTWAALGLGLVMLTLVFGVDPNGSGARLWLGAGGLYFQPSEVLKVLAVVFFASYLDDYRELLAYAGPRVGPVRLPPLPYLAPLLLMFGLSQALLVWQRDLGAALLFFGVFLALLYVASGRWEYLAAGLGLFLAGATVAYRLFDHIQLRVAIWLDPWAQAETGGYQLTQALYALAGGGLTGVGLGRGYPEYIPAVHTDFVIAAIGEELGLAGALGVVALYALFVHLGLRIALAARSGFGQLLAAGLTAVVGIQSFIILAGTLRLVPLTGITLPLVSYGGSSVLANFLIVGLLLAVAGEEP